MIDCADAVDDGNYTALVELVSETLDRLADLIEDDPGRMTRAAYMAIADAAHRILVADYKPRVVQAPPARTRKVDPNGIYCQHGYLPSMCADCAVASGEWQWTPEGEMIRTESA